jgi:putative zinc finger protein
MNCDAFENLLADYLDGTLPAADQLALERHAESCSNCREFMAQATAGFEALKAVEPVEPPADLVTRIAYLAPAGKVRKATDRPGFLRRLSTRWLQPLLQPRLAMGMAMTFLSFTMMERCTGVRVQRIQITDLNPISMAQNVEDRVLRAKDRAVKYYQNIRFVYDVEVKLREMDEQRAQVEEEARRRATRNGASASQSSGKRSDDSSKHKEVSK